MGGRTSFKVGIQNFKKVLTLQAIGAALPGSKTVLHHNTIQQS
jgi:hypothetical protein